jgi:hypothetical protein
MFTKQVRVSQDPEHTPSPAKDKPLECTIWQMYIPSQIYKIQPDAFKFKPGLI